MKIIGHRGAMAYEPENTLLSFKKAYELNCSFIELDVYNIQNKLLVFHDDTLDRTTNGKGYLENHSFEELRKLDAGKGQCIPLLEEVIEITPKQVVINVELKGKNTAKLVSEIIKNNPKNKFIVSSFNNKELLKFGEFSPSTPIWVLLNKNPLGAWKFKRISQQFKNVISINPGLKFVNKKLVENCHLLGYEVYVWTVNEMQDFYRVKDLGVDGLFSNCPDKFIALN